MSHIAIIMVKVVAEAPEFGQGDTDARPKPDPRASKIKEVATVAKAPAIIGGQAIPDVDASTVWPASPLP
jgi:hypothetical protein